MLVTEHGDGDVGTDLGACRIAVNVRISVPAFTVPIKNPVVAAISIMMVFESERGGGQCFARLSAVVIADVPLPSALFLEGQGRWQEKHHGREQVLRRLHRDVKSLKTLLSLVRRMSNRSCAIPNKG